jgi:hypothetical protein
MVKKKAKQKVFVFAMDHALPTAMAMHEDGRVLYQHGGSDYDDAVYWLNYHHPDLQTDYEYQELDKNLIKAHIYDGADIKTLGVDVQEAFTKNQELGKAAKAKEDGHS